MYLQIQRWMRAAGMTAWIDAVGNVRGRAASRNPDAPAMFVGSHYDSVVDGGMYDGAMGIITGIAAIKILVLESAVSAGNISITSVIKAVQECEAKKVAGEDGTLNIMALLPPRAHLPLVKVPIEVAAFADEEGVRFQTTFLGSRTLAGTLLSSGALESRDGKGATLSDALMEVGMEGTPEALSAAALDPASIAGYVEVHLEQGPVLESSGRAVGVVRGIAGQSRLVLTLHGEQGHAGTVPMRLRRDPLAGAAEIMAKIENICREKATKETGGGDDSLVCTVGSLFVWPGAVNVIPGAANFTLDVRCQSDTVRTTVLDAVRSHVSQVCLRRGLQCSVDLRHDVGAVPCSPTLVSRLADAVEASAERLLPRLQLNKTIEDEHEEFGVRCSKDHSTHTSCPAPATFQLPTVKTTSGAEVVVLASGAGHDAMAMAHITPIGMLFVRCRGGISHNPAEWVDPDDVATGAAALVQFLHSWSHQDTLGVAAA